jgi:hypothetical protein
MHGWAPGVIGAIGTPKTRPEGYLNVIFTKSASSQQAGKEALGRMYARTLDRDQATTWATREAQYDAACAWGIPDHALLQRLSGIDLPVFVANGDNDPMILACYSYLLAGLIEVEDHVVNPLGVKGVGEIGQVGTAAAIANAVYHATGYRVRELPIATEHLLAYTPPEPTPAAPQAPPTAT